MFQCLQILGLTTLVLYYIYYINNTRVIGILKRDGNFV